MASSPADRRIVLVTGASRGIGRAAALDLASAGNHIIATARSSKALEKLDDEIKAKTGHNATLIPLDMRDMNGIDRLASALLERFGRLDGLLGNAGVLGTLGPLEQITPAAFQETMDVNFTANWRLIRALHPLLRVSEAGRALFVTSGVVPRPRAYWGIYAASKAALETMIACYADEVEKTPIRVNLFDPGAVRTEMRFKAMPGEDRSLLPTPEEVASTIPFYLSPECSFHGERVEFRAIVKK
ncbi:MAG TPA: SDR family NAD(P)-dependent oxidoreductase [Hyphomonadaceae bacterium]|jgi:NAD(P)-dependent dehydrogenase (short-subunit alcohol dehydrogenase family)